MKIDISVIIPAYNAEKYLAKSIESALSQKGVSLEVILVDDGSTDGTLAIMQRFAAQDQRVKLIENSRNLGLSASRNVGIQASLGEWVTPLDADDWYGEGRLARLLEASRQYDAEMVADDQFLVSAGSTKRPKTLLAKRFQGRETLIGPNDFIKETIPNPYKKSMGYIKPLLRREFMLSEDLFFDDDLRQFIDWEFWLRCLFNDARLLIVGTPGYYYLYDAPGSMSKKKPKHNVALLREITERLSRLAQEKCKDGALPLLQERMKMLHRMDTYLNISSNLKAWQFHKAIGHILRDPAAIPQIISLSAYSAWIRARGGARKLGYQS